MIKSSEYIEEIKKLKLSPAQEVIEEIKKIIRMSAYERGHSGGIEEVQAIEKGLMTDFSTVFVKLRAIDAEII